MNTQAADVVLNCCSFGSVADNFKRPTLDPRIGCDLAPSLDEYSVPLSGDQPSYDTYDLWTAVAKRRRVDAGVNDAEAVAREWRSETDEVIPDHVGDRKDRVEQEWSKSTNYCLVTSELRHVDGEDMPRAQAGKGRGKPRGGAEEKMMRIDRHWASARECTCQRKRVVTKSVEPGVPGEGHQLKRRADPRIE